MARRRNLPLRRAGLSAARWFSRSLQLLCAAALLTAAAPHRTLAQTTAAKTTTATTAPLTTAAVVERDVRRVTVVRNKSRTIGLGWAFESAVVGSPEIAEVLPMSDNVLYILGKKPGTTNISIFPKDKDKERMVVIDVDVIVDVDAIAKSIHSSTESKGIRVSSANDQVVLSGMARDATEAERAVSIAKAMVPSASVINAMKMAPSQQVMLKVRYLEVDRKAGREIGVNWYGSNRDGTRGLQTGLGEGEPFNEIVPGIPLFKTIGTFAAGGTAEPFGIAVAQVFGGSNKLDVAITALESKGLVRALAQPDLVALSGDKASFLAGGQIPVPVPQPSGVTTLITIEWKKYGVELEFVPTVLGNGIINLRIHPTVNELDYANKVRLVGYDIPALTTRETDTTIELRDGQSFAISGLLQDESRRDISQVPWIGSVPVLGALFRSTSYLQKETDLVVIATPHLVQPAVPGQQLATPLDQRLPANDVDLFLNGQTDLRKQYQDYVTAGRDIRGPYGHIMPLTTKK